MPLTTLFVLAVATSAPSPFEAALAKISTADGLTATFLDRSLNGEKAQWTLKVQRPNKIFADSATRCVIADGSQIIFLDKSDSKYTQLPETDFAFQKLLSRPEFFLARLMIQSDAAWVSKTTSLTPKNRDGVDLIGSQVVPDELETASIYVTQQDRIALIEVDAGVSTPRATHVLDKIQLIPASVPDTVFQLSLPPDAVAIGAGQTSSTQSEGAKRDAANGLLPYKQLAWEDFPVTSSPASPFLADTEAFIHYDFRCNYRESNGAFIATVTQIEIRSGLDRPRSWRKSELTFDPVKLLRHEQGHLDINELHARRLRKEMLAQMPKGHGDTGPAAEADLAAKMKALVGSALADSSAEQKLYDDETDHGKNEGAQQNWLSKIKKELEDASKLP